MTEQSNQQAKLDFIVILSNLNRKFEVILCKWTNEKEFEVRIRTEIDHDNDDFNGLCDQWVEQFSKITNTIWVKKISNTGPKIRFRKQYQCWTNGAGKVKKELLFDARRCRAVLDMKVLTDTPLTRRKNKHMRMGLNAVVKINFTHLHDVKTDEAFSFFVHNCPAQPEPIFVNKTSRTVHDNVKSNKKSSQTQELKMTNTNITNHLSSHLLMNNSSIPPTNHHSVLLNNGGGLDTTMQQRSSQMQHFPMFPNHHSTPTHQSSSNEQQQRHPMLMCTPTFLFDSSHHHGIQTSLNIPQLQEHLVQMQQQAQQLQQHHQQQQQQQTENLHSN